MPEHLRALVVILALAGPVFLLAKPTLVAFAVAEDEFNRRRNLWLAVTLIAFLSHSFWIFLAVTAALLLIAGRRETNPMAMFAMLMFAIPPISAPLSGLGLVNQLFVLDYPRLLALCLLLPAAIRIARTGAPDSGSFKLADLLVIGFIATQLGLRLLVDSGTNTARHAIYAGLDVGLPYYVASRSLRDVRAFRGVLASFVLAAMVMAPVAIFESVRHWLLYAPLQYALDVSWGLGSYLYRGGFLRSQGTTGQPIVLGYIFVVALGCHAYLRRRIPVRSMWWLGFMLLIGGLIASFSRGPWVAAIAGLVVFRLTAPEAVGGLLKASVGLGALVAVVMSMPLGADVISFLPFVGSVETENVVYRQQLLDVSFNLILQNPWFGSVGYADALAAQDLVIGGMVDIVNTYIAIGLANGLVGLSCFAGAFLVVAFGVLRAMWRLPDRSAEAHTLGSGLLACIAGAMVTIFTVSSISFIPLVYWTLLGLGAGYVRMLQSHVPAAPDNQSAPQGRFTRPAGAGISGQGANAA